ncbi:GntR family transcriptional regulator [Beijerinckia sp. L45]|uniref:GntR family transcriptional regulator n=1 Tax=Beijerinckia sp. L45 TaxID=1641855 RepID=UPI00131BF0FF|nr:GntR family transcriptional regulator [Beijerinckia sp. L45]
MLLRDDIYGSVRSDILACRLAPGEEMREQDLAAKYNVSRAPIRDALLRLEREHLVTVNARQGSRVNPISLSDANEIFQMRSVLEPACASAAAENAGLDILQSLDIYRTFEAGSEFIAYNRAFHAAIAEASGNRRMARTTTELLDQSERLVRVSLAGIKGRDPAQLVAEHNALIDAIQSRNARGAVRIARDHVSKAQRRVLSALAFSAVVS